MYGNFSNKTLERELNHKAKKPPFPPHFRDECSIFSAIMASGRCQRQSSREIGDADCYFDQRKAQAKLHTMVRLRRLCGGCQCQGRQIYR